MNLFLTDNLLKINQVVRLSENEYTPASSDTPATIACTKANIRALYDAKIHFVLDLDSKEKLPFKKLPFKLYADGTRMYVPDYVPTRIEQPQTYSVQYRKEDKNVFKTGVTEKGLQNAIEAGVRIRRIAPEQAARFKKAFLKKFGLEVVKEGDFQYAKFPSAKKKTPTRKSARA